MKRQKDTKFYKSKMRLEEKTLFFSKIYNSVKNSSLVEHERGMLYMMLDISNTFDQIYDEFFELLRYSDGKYTLIVRRDLNDIVSINFEINPYYNGLR